MIRVFIVESSPPSGQRLARTLLQTGEIRVVGNAGDATTACEQIVELEPDVVVLDGELPNVDGVSFVERLTRHSSSRVVLYSDVSSLRGEAATRALAAGANAVVSKCGVFSSQVQTGQELLAAVRGAAVTTPSQRGLDPNATQRDSGVQQRPLAGLERRIIGIGASTGGAAAVERLVRSLAPDTPPVLIVQHLPDYILPAFAERLNAAGEVPVELARHGAILDEGSVVVAPGNVHLTVERVGEYWQICLTNGASIHRPRPAVDALFFSLARTAGAGAVGVVLTGSGRDGAAGLLALRAVGARTLVQDEPTSVVWGMPKAAIELGAAQEILALDDLCARISAFAVRSRPTIAAAG